MPRLISVALTEAAVADRSKTVTRRIGWRHVAVGDRLTLCRKVMGRRRQDGFVEPLVRLAEVQVVDVRREPLNAITATDVALEGFPDWTPSEFVAFFCKSMRCEQWTEVTRIEWRYLPDEQS